MKVLLFISLSPPKVTFIKSACSLSPFISFRFNHVGGFQFGGGNGCSTLEGLFIRAGVAVNSVMHNGNKLPSVEKEGFVPALCASSIITTDRYSLSYSPVTAWVCLVRNSKLISY